MKEKKGHISFWLKERLYRVRRKDAAACNKRIRENRRSRDSGCTIYTWLYVQNFLQLNLLNGSIPRVHPRIASLSTRIIKGLKMCEVRETSVEGRRRRWRSRGFYTQKPETGKKAYRYGGYRDGRNTRRGSDRLKGKRVQSVWIQTRSLCFLYHLRIASYFYLIYFYHRINHAIATKPFVDQITKYDSITVHTVYISDSFTNS